MYELNRMEIDFKNWHKISEIKPKEHRKYRVLYYSDNPKVMISKILNYTTIFTCNKYIDCWKEPTVTGTSYFTIEDEPDFWQELDHDGY